MGKRYLFITLQFISSLAAAQNLVLNPGFENYITCPGFGQYSSSYIVSWDKPSIASSDYYHYACPGIQPSVQSPRTGEAYSGIIAYNYGTEYREYITGMFSSPLIAGTSYDVEFYVSLNDGYIQAINEMGAYISPAAPGFFSNVLHINVTPQIENTSGALNDTANWKRVHGQYLAAGGEQYITIGNFHDDAGTTITQPGTVGSFGAYYFVDDVSVTVDSTTSLHNTQAILPTVQYNNNHLLIQYPSASWQDGIELFIYDSLGKIVCRIQNPDNNINVQELRKGVYSVILRKKTQEQFAAKILIY